MRGEELIPLEGYPVDEDAYYKLQAEFLKDIYIAEHLGISAIRFQNYKYKFGLNNLGKENNPYLVDKVIDMANSGLNKSQIAAKLKMHHKRFDMFLENFELTDLAFGNRTFVPYEPLDYYKLKAEGLSDLQISKRWEIPYKKVLSWRKEKGIKAGRELAYVKRGYWSVIYKKEVAKARAKSS